jgi:hypothetical protein
MADITYQNKNTGDQFTAAEANEIKTAVNTKVDKVAGKGLSTNDFDAAAKGKVDNLPANTIAELGNKAELTQVSELTLLVAGWSLVSGVYRNEITHESITADSVVDVIPANSTIEVVRVANVLPETNSEAGKVYVYAKNIPSGPIDVTINVFK